MRVPIPLPVKNVRLAWGSTPTHWEADITFGIPNDTSHDDPTITLHSETGIPLPKIGDFLLVLPPEIVGTAPTYSTRDLNTP